jgi:membrane peptidoglycan carboxypeptidase
VQQFTAFLKRRRSAQGDLTDAQAQTKPLPNRNVRRALLIAKIGLVVLLVMAGGIGLLYALTPSAGQAASRTRQFAAQHGISYPGPPVPPLFADALVATEDHRFYSDPGIDVLAIGRVVVSKIGGRQDQGGSTIYQQLAKMLYTPGGGGFTSVLKDVVLAVKLRQTYSPAQVLQMYSLVAYYGHGYYGLEQASCGYFGHPPAQLTLVQAAMLAGAVNAPTYDDPLTHPQQARARLVHVLGRMQAVGYLTSAQEQQALKTPLGLPATRGCR